MHTCPHTHKCMPVWWCLTLTLCNTFHPQQSAHYNRMEKEREIDRESRRNQTEALHMFQYIQMFLQPPYTTSSTAIPTQNIFYPMLIKKILTLHWLWQLHNAQWIIPCQCCFIPHLYSRPLQTPNWKTNNKKTSMYNTNQIRWKSWDKSRKMKTKSTNTFLCLVYIMWPVALFICQMVD